MSGLVSAGVVIAAVWRAADVTNSPPSLTRHSPRTTFQGEKGIAVKGSGQAAIDSTVSLTYPYSGREFRIPDVSGKVIKEIFA